MQCFARGPEKASHKARNYVRHRRRLSDGLTRSRKYRCPHFNEGRPFRGEAKSGGAQMDDRFYIEESAALLRKIFPNYPDINGGKPTPNLAEFLREYRTAKAGNVPPQVAKAVA